LNRTELEGGGRSDGAEIGSRCGELPQGAFLRQQALDGVIDVLAHDPSKTCGPFAFAVPNAIVVIWLLGVYPGGEPTLSWNHCTRNRMVTSVKAWFHQLPRSGNDFDRRADVNQLPDFVHFFVRDGDATIRPVMHSVCLPHPRVLLRQSVQHNVTPRVDA
jgi:hypothetical protein